MKKKGFLLLVSLLTFAVTIQSQVKLGVKAGINLSTISYEGNSNLANVYNDNLGNMTGFQAGPIVEFTLPVVGIGLDAAVLYSQEGFQFDAGSLSETYKANLLEIPVNLKAKLNLLNVVGVYATAGPYVNFKLSDNLKEQYYDQTFGAGLNFGVGVELLGHLQVGLNYKLALTDNYKNYHISNMDGLPEEIKAAQRTWTVSAAYFF